MRVGSFSLMVQEGRERDSAHVEMQHGSNYRLRLSNHDHTRRCDASIEIDGRSVGDFRIGAGGTITIERPANDQGKFTFYRSSSEEGKIVGAEKITADLRGLVQVTFRPEKIRHVAKNVPVSRPRGDMGTVETSAENEVRSRGLARSYGGMYQPGESPKAREYASGVTGLSGHSDQTFDTVAGLDYDQDRVTTISVRLVANDGPRPLVSVPKPLANAVPDPVE